MPSLTMLIKPNAKYAQIPRIILHWINLNLPLQWWELYGLLERYQTTSCRLVYFKDQNLRTVYRTSIMPIYPAYLREGVSNTADSNIIIMLRDKHFWYIYCLFFVIRNKGYVRAPVLYHFSEDAGSSLSSSTPIIPCTVKRHVITRNNTHASGLKVLL